MKIFLPYEKISKISDSARALLSPQTCSVRALARNIGLIASSFWAVLPTKLHYRSLGHLKLQTLKASNSNFELLCHLCPPFAPTCFGGHNQVTCIIVFLFDKPFTSSLLQQLMPQNLVGERYLKASIPVVGGHLKRSACI